MFQFKTKATRNLQVTRLITEKRGKIHTNLPRRRGGIKVNNPAGYRSYSGPKRSNNASHLARCKSTPDFIKLVYHLSE